MSADENRRQVLYWRLLARYLRPEWPRMGLLAVVLGGAIGVQVITPSGPQRWISRIEEAPLDGCAASSRVTGQQREESAL